ncbi:protein GRAVITROPIC IN THE LIGHT 1 isoform X2 [Jatropha curcas]|uniref:protein GRAVITROPIC IN THE LIGHT 1 isoform X2 n=1 Tax=Jatropha curcas TaxID=180498 RepID=UPI0009D725BE|nr:protein GRAVITROPIC IN THE LIGHT 1 isoform X2 [Jatropha curcas]
MFSSMLLCSMRSNSSRAKKKRENLQKQTDDFETEANDAGLFFSLPYNRDPVVAKPSRFTLRSDHISRSQFQAKKKGEMANKVSNFSDLIQRVAASCLLHPLAAGRQDSGNVTGDERQIYEYETDEQEDLEEEEEEDEGETESVEMGEKKGRVKGWDQEKKSKGGMGAIERVIEMEMLMNEVFDSVSAMKRAYASLQEAHCPWDPDRMRVADVAVVAELRRLGILRERFRRSVSIAGHGGRKRIGGNGEGMGMLREVVAPYEAAVEELKREVKTREVEVENLKEKIKNLSTNSNGKKGRSQSKRKVSCSSQAAQVAASPAPDLFEATMNQVKETSKSFTSLLLSLMRAAHWDIAAAVRSIEAATASTDNCIITNTTTIASTIVTHHAKYAVESYISRKIFQGFDHETFYMDGSLSSLLNPDQFRRDCFAQYRDMKGMDPVELLGILPTCHFGKFCFKKYVAIVHPKMEESLFGNLEQRQQVLAGSHPRSQFYGEFLGLAKTIWLLHLLAFSLDPAPSQFEASRGAAFHPQYMESVVKFSGGRIPAGHIVGFPVSPGFKLGSGLVIRARVYLVART